MGPIAPEQLEDQPPISRGVTIDAVMVAFSKIDGAPMSKRRAYEIAQAEEWRILPGTRPRQYAWDDVVRTSTQRKAPR